MWLEDLNTRLILAYMPNPWLQVRIFYSRKEAVLPEEEFPKLKKRKLSFMAKLLTNIYYNNTLL